MYKVQCGDPDVHHVQRYLPGAGHQPVLVATRLARLKKLEKSQQLGRVLQKQG
jgi:hypothetical protein